jgi:hypothetical protein
VAKEIIGKAREVGATIIVMKNLRHLNRKDKDSKELMGEYTAGHIEGSSKY